MTTEIANPMTPDSALPSHFLLVPGTLWGLNNIS